MEKYRKPTSEDFKIGLSYEIYQDKNWVTKIINNQQHLDYLLFDSRGIKEAYKIIENIIRIKIDE